MLGVKIYGEKELIPFEDGYCDGKEGWLSLMKNLKERGLTQAPAVGDGALGFWGALNEGFPTVRHQRCWFHKMENALDKLPKSQQSQTKTDLQDIGMSATRDEACTAFDQLVNTYKLKYPKATECLLKDREALLTFYDFPAKRLPHMRTTNPIESTFATVRHRTKKVNNFFSRTAILTMVFKLPQRTQKRWSGLRGFKRFGEVASGVRFVDGLKAEGDEQHELSHHRSAA